MSLEATINVNSLPDQELEKILEAVTEYENSLEADQPLNSDNLGKNLNGFFTFQKRNSNVII